MKPNLRAISFSIFFLSVFFIKMAISAAPVFLNMDKKVVKAVILQLELENNSKDTPSESKDVGNYFKKGYDFIHYNDFEIAKLISFDDVNYHFVRKKYINTFFPIVPTPPPNLA